MSKLVDLDEFRLEHTAKRGFAAWEKRFGKVFDALTRFSDLDNSTISALAEPGEASATIFYELIMGILDLGNVLKFEYLKPAERMRVVDTHLFLVDLARYEMMRRINWIDDYQKREQSLISLVETYDHTDYSRYKVPPQLSTDHPEYQEFQSRITREKVVMLRQLFQDALIQFNKTFDLP